MLNLWNTKNNKGTYKDGEKDGRETHWFESGEKKSETHYKNGERERLETCWYKSGEKESEIH